MFWIQKVNPLLHVTPNVEMNTNLMEQSWRNKVRKFIFISSNTTYPDVGGRIYVQRTWKYLLQIYPLQSGLDEEIWRNTL